MVSEPIFLVIALVTFVLLVAYFFPEEVGSAVSTLEIVLGAFWGLVAILFALAFLTSGRESLMFVGALILAYIALRIWFGFGVDDEVTT